MKLSKKDADKIKGLLCVLVDFRLIHGWWSPSGENGDIKILMESEEDLGRWWSWFI